MLLDLLSESFIVPRRSIHFDDVTFASFEKTLFLKFSVFRKLFDISKLELNVSPDNTFI